MIPLLQLTEIFKYISDISDIFFDLQDISIFKTKKKKKKLSSRSKKVAFLLCSELDLDSKSQLLEVAGIPGSPDGLIAKAAFQFRLCCYAGGLPSEGMMQGL